MDVRHIGRGNHATGQCKINAKGTRKSCLGCKFNGR